MKFLSLLMWVGQFGFSVLFPTCFFLFVAVWLQQKFELGIWIVAVLGVIGLLTSFSTAKSCLQAILKEIERNSDRRDPPPSFNDHS
ncbi:MAG: AtpZ/AtpI family protein [Ruminiclostridium sp.]|nr:AtpZ/AtpI family protein [Ruminiclostridium sp.]